MAAANTEDTDAMVELPKLRLILAQDRDSVKLNGTIEVTARVLYDAAPGSRPIVVHFPGFLDGGLECLPLDDPDEGVSIVGNRLFKFLKPGQSIDTTYHIAPYDTYIMPKDLQPGDEVRYQYHGCNIDWWNWGTEEDHKDTKVVILGDKGGWVVNPDDNDGRPHTQTPKSNAVEFRIAR